MFKLKNLLISLLLLMAKFTIGQDNYNDLYFDNLKGKVKVCPTTIESYNSKSFNFGHLKKIISSYNQNGNCYLETEWSDSIIIQKRAIFYDNLKGSEKRIKKITTHAIDSSNKTIHHYYFDESGFDTTIVVCDQDSSYNYINKYEKNNFGLRSKGTEINQKNGFIFRSFEIYYSKDKMIDSIIYKTGKGIVNYIEYYMYNSQNEVAQIYYSDEGCNQFEYDKIDEFGNWMEMNIYFAKDEQKVLLSKHQRQIEYY